MPRLKILPIVELKIHCDTQSRIATNDDTVDDYHAVLKASNGHWPFPPLDVFHDGTAYFVGDGFHRILAAARANFIDIPCKVHKGDARDARIFGMTANDKNGMRMTPEDKRACVEWLLDGDEKLNQTKIAALAGVSTRTVKRIVKDRKAEKVTVAPLPETEDYVEPRENKKKAKLPRKLDEVAYYKQWTDTIGPLVRLVDSIGIGVDQHNSVKQRKVEKCLHDATAAMKAWMKVK